MKNIALRGFCSAFLAAGLMACSSSDDVVFQPSIPVTVNLLAQDEINKFEDELARPVIVRLYQLRDVGTFEQADFVTIYESGDSVLASSMVDSKILSPVLPGERRSFTIEVQQETKFLAVFAEFANYEVATTKASVALVEEPEDSPVVITVSQAKIEISQPVDSSWW
ncbi:type VI secretion system lipoprotein TssJ [Vibrio fluminensis]|uniref:type VI secretion system lipoprotein TssJ n=1 Tax=Vibrio fluminensis TaxID=2783614 RepID=UPI001887B013|nr:type VI secretion system lipoprotein TssJ [Vibrio fluminensis]